MLTWSEASPIKSLPVQDELATMRENLDKITTEDFKILPNKKNGLSYTIFFRLKLLRKSYLVFAKILAITDADDGKLKEKSLFNIDPSSFIKLRGYKVIPKDSTKSNIMKILFPRKKSTQVKTDFKKVDKTSDEPLTSSVHEDLQKDFIEVDDILLVRDPSKMDSLLKNELDDEEPDQTPHSYNYQNQKENRKSAPRAIDLVLNQSLRLQKSAKGLNLSKMANLDQLFRPSADRELFKREDNAKESPNENRPIENSTDLGVDSRTERKSESSSIEGRTDFGEDSTKVGQTLNQENEKKDIENVAEQLQSVHQSDVESSSAVESVKQDEITVNGDSATTSVPTDSLKIDVQPVTTEIAAETTEKVGASQSTSESENKEEQMLGA